MTDKEKVIQWLWFVKKRQHGASCFSEECPYLDKSGGSLTCCEKGADDALALLREQDSTLGMHIHTDGIDFVATGDAKQGEDRGYVLGKATMYDHIEKELLYADLLTDDVKAVLDKVKRELS